MRTSKFRLERVFIVFLVLIGPAGLSGCGRHGEAAASSLQGVYIDANTISYLQSKFEETKTCTHSAKGDFGDLSIVMMPPSFTCPYYATGCSGEFDEPNLVKIGMFSSWKHEVVHYLLYLNTGDPDTNYNSPFFQTCTT